MYGSGYAGELPGSVLAVPLRLAFTFVAPATITGYAPALLILQLPGPAFLPAWLGWCAPLFAGTTWLLAWLAWRAGIRRFTGAGRLAMEPIIEFEDLRRTFVVRRKAGNLRREKTLVHAVDGITASIMPGEAVGYIGANGAGKSTTIKMLTGILVPTSGRVRTCGLEPVPQRRRLARELGVVFGQRSQLWWDLPLRDSFKIWRPSTAWPPVRRPIVRSTLSRDSDCARFSIPRSASCPWASGCVARWRPPSFTGHACWSWTSRRSAWT